MNTIRLRRILTLAVTILTLFVGQSTAFAIPYPANSGVLNVKDYGAKGDGATDDTAAINFAIAASTPPGNTGIYWGQAKIVYFPAGRYLISGPLIKKDVSSGNATYGMVLIGQSQGTTTIRLSPGAPGFGEGENRRATPTTRKPRMRKSSVTYRPIRPEAPSTRILRASPIRVLCGSA